MKRAMIYAVVAGLAAGTGSLAQAQYNQAQYNSDSGSGSGGMQTPGSRAGGSMGQSGGSSSGTPSGMQAQIPESEVKLALEQQGFTDVRDVRQRGDMITAKAKRNGQDQRVEIDTATGMMRAGQ